MEYCTYYNGEWTHVYNLEDCIRAIQCRNEDNVKRIKYLEEENRKKMRESSEKDSVTQLPNKLKCEEKVNSVYISTFIDTAN